MNQIRKGMKSYSLSLGSLYGFWKVLEKGPPRSCKSLCLCTKCNVTTKLVRNKALASGESTSCGCVAIEIVKDKMFGFWKVLDVQGTHTLCLCTGCNETQKLVLNRNLRTNRSSSCGCQKISLRVDKCMSKYQVQGAFSKLLRYVENKYSPTFIESYCDLRYSSGISYEKCGFQLQHITSPGFVWTDFKTTYHRLQCRANMDHRKLSQAEHAKELKWHKIFDAGQAKYRKDLK